MKIILLSLLSIFTSAECFHQYPSTYQAYTKIKYSTSILKNKQLFKVKSGKLDVLSKSGKLVRFVDVVVKNDESAERYFTYVGEIKSINSFFVQETGYEIGSVIMVTKKGSKVNLWAVPSVSPNNRFAVGLSQSIDNEIIPNGIQILFLENGEVKNKCDIFIKYLEPQGLRWVSDKSFIVKFQKFNSNGERINKFSYLEYRIN
jgi:hypothetical protein